MIKIRRSKKDNKICGVCGGIAEYLHRDANLLRLLWVFFTIVTGGIGVFLYILLAVLMEKPEEKETEYF